MNKNNITIAIIIAFILSACQQPTPTYNKDYSNKKVFVLIIGGLKEHQVDGLVKELDKSNNRYQTMLNFPNIGKKYSFWTTSTQMNPRDGNIIFELKENEYQSSRTPSGYYNLYYVYKKMTKKEFKEQELKKNNETLNRIASHETNYIKKHKVILANLPEKKTTYVQPYNKKESCKIWFGYTEDDKWFEEDSYKISWDGKCKDGFASGLGREIESADMMDKWGIAIYKKGKPTYYIIKDNLSDMLFEGINESGNENTVGVYTTIKEKNKDIDITARASAYDSETHVLYNSFTSPFWNGTYTYTKRYFNFQYVYQDNTQNDIAQMDFEFRIQNKEAVNIGWTIAKQKKSTSLITGEFIDGKFKPFKLPKSYNDKADGILREIKKGSQKAYQAQEQALKVKRQYIKKVCKKSVKVDWMDNDDYKDICNPKREIALMKKINAKLQKISEEKITRLEKQKYKEQQQKEESHRQEILNIERQRLAEINRHNSRIEAQEDSRQFQQSLNNLNKQIRDMTPKTYNVNVMHY